MKLVEAWVELHQDELMADWYLASTGQMPFKIDPLRQGDADDNVGFVRVLLTW